MLVVARNAHKYNHASKVSTWIFAIAYRKALKALRDVNDPVDLDRSLDDLLGPDQHEPKDAMLLLQLRRVLGEGGSLKALSANHRAVIELTYFQGALAVAKSPK